MSPAPKRFFLDTNIFVHTFDSGSAANARSRSQIYLEQVLMPLCEVFPNASPYSQAIALREQTQLSFYDSLIVSSAMEADCRILWTEDLQHGQRIRNLEIRNPFDH
jgi:predicted nucleic acid-binding protein